MFEFSSASRFPSRRMGLKSLCINKMWSQNKQLFEVHQNFTIYFSGSGKTPWVYNLSPSIYITGRRKYILYMMFHNQVIGLNSLIHQKMPLLFNHHMILGKEQIPQMMQTLVHQYTSRGSSNINSKAQQMMLSRVENSQCQNETLSFGC